MRRNDLHPENLPRRLRYRSLHLDTINEGPGACLVESLRDRASHEEAMAEIWEGDDPEGRVAEGRLHEIWQHRRNARRLNELADAIERDLEAGPWVSLDQPVVHLDEARTTGEEVH